MKKIIQFYPISANCKKDGNHTHIFVLCDDSSIWSMCEKDGGWICETKDFEEETKEK